MKKTRIIRTAEVTVETEQTTVVRGKVNSISQHTTPGSGVRGSRPSKGEKDGTTAALIHKGVEP